MNKLIAYYKSWILLIAILLPLTASATGERKISFAPAIISDFSLTIQHVTQTADNKFEFDVYILDTDPAQDFNLIIFQYGILINSTISTGTITASIVNTNSGLNSTLQTTAAPNTATRITTTNPNQIMLKLAGGVSFSLANAALISKTSPGTLMTHFIITSSVPFAANATPSLIFCSNLVSSPYYGTKITIWDSSQRNPATALTVTPNVNAIVNGNPILNKTIAAQNVTVGGSYCQGGAGVVVGLVGSEVGITYTLYKNTLPTASTVVGNGSAISFPAQTTGTYTVKGSYVNGPNVWGTTDMTGSAVITENPELIAGVSIVEDANNVCEGTSVTYTATPTHGGTAPSYQWYVGTQAVGLNLSTYTYTPVNGDAIKVTMTSNATPCLAGSPVTSTSVIMTVTALAPACVFIAADQNNVCAGTSVTYSVTSTCGGGTTPTYQWYKGAALVGQNSATYAYIPASGDVIKVVMTSSSPCATSSPATSNNVTVVVNPIITASVTIEASSNPVQNGAPVTFTPTAMVGATTPKYEWFKNSNLITTGITGDTYTYTPIDGDNVYAIMTSTASPCVSGIPAKSNIITMSVSLGTGLDKNGKVKVNIYSYDKNIFIYSSETVNQINIYNAVGTLIKIVSNSSDIHKISMMSYPIGCYIVSLITDKNVYSDKVILK